GASRRLRRLENKVPAVIYGGQQEPQALSLKDNELINAMRNEAFFSQVIELSVDGKEEPV
ncbi:MAG TPA: 50S ribosomal protein L25, partial [Gammaproteobacteria bacterium]|nr:50S ribosomal protein L25 [Gammaproteobacteria bacterium]